MIDENNFKEGALTRQTGKKEPIAYVIEDKVFGTFEVLNSANAWWLDKSKVSNLISAYKIDCTDAEACVYAGISIKQLEYFEELHINFSEIKKACKQLPFLKARQTIAQSLGEIKDAQWFMERKLKKEFAQRNELTGKEGEPIETEDKSKPLLELIKNASPENRQQFIIALRAVRGANGDGVNAGDQGTGGGEQQGRGEGVVPSALTELDRGADIPSETGDKELEAGSVAQ